MNSLKSVTGALWVFKRYMIIDKTTYIHYKVVTRLTISHKSNSYIFMMFYASTQTSQV